MLVSIDFSEYKPWMGAQDTYDIIEGEDKLQQLEDFLEEHFYGRVPRVEEVNDLLWFESDFVLSVLGIDHDEN